MSKMKMPAVALAALMAARPVAVVGQVKAEASVDAEALLKEVSAKLAKLNGEVKQTAEDALKQAKNAGEVSAETKAKADQMLAAQDGLSKAVSALTDRLEGVDTKAQEIAQAVANGAGRGAGAPRQTMGQAVVAESDRIAAFIAAGAKGSLAFDVSNAITTAAGSGGGLIYHEEEREPVNMPRRVLRVASRVTRGRTGSDLVTFRRQTLRTDATAMVAETGTYPESAFGWTKATEQVKKVGAITHISEEALADADQLQTEIDTELRYGLDLEIEKQVLAGDGLGENLKGLIPNATAFSAAAGLPNATRIDRLRLAILQVVLADYVPQEIVLNPTDWAGIDLLKDTAGRFVFGNPGAQSTPTLWGKDVIESNSMTAGEWLVGDLMMAATLYDRSEVEVLISSEHGTNFVEDMLTMKARKRMVQAIKRGAAMVTGDFTFA